MNAIALLLSIEGVCCVMVIVDGNECVDPSSNPGRGSLHFTLY